MISTKGLNVKPKCKQCGQPTKVNGTTCDICLKINNLHIDYTRAEAEGDYERCERLVARIRELQEMI